MAEESKTPDMYVTYAPSDEVQTGTERVYITPTATDFSNNPEDGAISSGNIADIYKVLAPMAGQYANAQAEQIAQAQQSMGVLAGQTMGDSRTAGLGNYTYNRLMRPQVDTMRDELLAKGYATQLNQLLSDALNSARRRYNRTHGGTTDDNEKKGNGTTTIDGYDDDDTGGGSSKYDVLYNHYYIIDKDGNRKKYTRPSVMSDVEWYNFTQKVKRQTEEKGEQFEMGE